MDPLISKGAHMIREAQKILVFTGAGLSTESGIPDFRSPGGLWEKYDPQDFYFQKFTSDERAREKYWEMSSELYGMLKAARPNPAHLAIVTLEKAGKLLSLITQNIDNLHHRAGNSPERIIELHGTAVTVSCLNCKKGYDRDDIQMRLNSGLKVPYCDACGGILKPDTISFGQAMPEKEMEDAISYAEACDLCMVLGSSLVVYPAASIPIHAQRNGAKLMIINLGTTPHDSEADLVIHKPVSTALSEMLGKDFS
ncbi:MAG: Sir2 family NAD-dependent protein deacetylase [Deltaproteobacteria bacterium]|nr:Sir2 family NAD-dependent protein deacetylase [Deltaproteobacteria bacterium]